MRCFSGGEDWLTPHHLGVCAYNCTLVEVKDQTLPCTAPTTQQAMQDCILTCTDSQM